MTLGSTALGLLLVASPSSGPGDEARVAPFELRRSMPFVQVMVNGQGPFVFGVDTGTGTDALVSPAVAEQLKLPASGETEAGDPSGKNPRRLPVVRVTSLSVAGVEFREVRAAVYQPSQAGGRCDGILGFPLFRDQLLTLDYPGSRMTLRAGRLTESADGTVVRFRAPDGVPVVDLTVDSEVIPAAIDSRGSGLALPASRAERLKTLGDPVVVGRGRTISGEFEIRGVQLAADVQLGGYRFHQPFVMLHPSFPIGNVGGMVLRQLVVTFDQGAGLMRIEAPQRTLELPRPQARAAPGAASPGAPPAAADGGRH